MLSRPLRSIRGISRAIETCLIALASLAAPPALAEGYDADSTAAGSPIPFRGDSTRAFAAPGGRIKSGKTALLYSLLGTAVPAAASAPLIWTPNAPDGAAVVLAGAVLIGPSLGHFYAGRPGAAFAGIGIRILAGAGIAIGGLASASEGGATSGSNAIAAIGVIVGGASIAWDILRAPHSARVHNDQVRQDRVGIGIVPSMGASGAGLRATATF